MDSLWGVNTKINTMKNLLIATTILLILNVFGGCSDESAPAYEFKDQNLKGKINNEPWNFVSGTAFYSNQSGKLLVNLLTLEIPDPCKYFLIDGNFDENRLYFSTPYQTGIFKLFINFDNGDEQTITLFDDSDHLNIISDDGAIEITSISDNLITGKIDARVDGESFVNGNFSIPLCQ
jgi:hypothetical protein